MDNDLQENKKSFLPLVVTKVLTWVLTKCCCPHHHMLNCGGRGVLLGSIFGRKKKLILFWVSLSIKKMITGLIGFDCKMTMSVHMSIGLSIKMSIRVNTLVNTFCGGNVYILVNNYYII